MHTYIHTYIHLHVCMHAQIHAYTEMNVYIYMQRESVCCTKSYKQIADIDMDRHIELLTRSVKDITLRANVPTKSKLRR